MTIYPLPMRFPVAGFHIDIVIDRESWSFCTATDRAAFEAQPVADRLELRRAFEAQVALAKKTPRDDNDGPEALKAMFR